MEKHSIDYLNDVAYHLGMNQLTTLKERQNSIFTKMAQVMNTLAAPVRMRLMHFLSQGPLSVEALSQKSGESMANTSMHLRKLLSQDLVQVSVSGKNRIYNLHPSLLLFWEVLQDFAQELDPTLGFEGMIPSEYLWNESTKKTLEMIKKNEVLLLDVRPHDETLSVLPHSLNIPLSDLPHRLKDLPKSKKIIVICRGRMCGLSVHGVEVLRSKGFKAFRWDKSVNALKLTPGKKRTEQ